MITPEQIQTAIDTLQINGSAVCIHSSMRSFSERVEGGPTALLNAFLTAGCTVLAPAFSDMFEAPPVRAYMPPQNGAGDYSYFYGKQYEDAGPYSPERNDYTVEDMGIFVRALLEHPGRMRGGNHLNSFVAAGPLAGEIAGCQTNADVYAPLARLYELDGYVLLMGVGLDCATAIHYAEQRAGRHPFVRWSRDVHGNTIPVAAGGCSEGFEKFAPLLAGCEKRITVGGSLWRCFPIRSLAEICADAIRRDPAITHCGDPECSRCNDALLGGPHFRF